MKAAATRMMDAENLIRDGIRFAGFFSHPSNTLLDLTLSLSLHCHGNLEGVASQYQFNILVTSILASYKYEGNPAYICIIIINVQCTCFNERCRRKEGRKKQARSNKQTRQSNTAHPRQSLSLSNMYMYLQAVLSFLHGLPGWVKYDAHEIQ